jgi:transcriptional repressor NrdR
MQCPSCRATTDLVIDSRMNPAGTEIRRRRECQTCQCRFTTYETIRDLDPAVAARQAQALAAQLRDLAETLEGS